MIIQKSTVYEQFGLIPGNRGLSQMHLAHLKESISKRNLLEQNPIIVNRDFEVIDGQHRLEVARQLSLPIYFVVMDYSENLQDVQLLNANLKPWSNLDYLESFVNLGYEDYVTLKAFCKKYGTPLRLSMALLAGIPLGNSDEIQRTMRAFKSGLFRIKTLELATTTVKKLIDFKPYVEKGVWCSLEFCLAMIEAEQVVKHDKLLHKVSLAKEKIQVHPSARLYKRELEDLYNFRMRSETRF